MKVLFVGAGPGAIDLLTVRAYNLIRTCRICVYAGSLVSPDVIALIPQEAKRFDSAGMTLEQIIGVFHDAREDDEDVVRLHTGDPSLFGAIGEQMRALQKLGIGYEIIPGVSAFQAGAAALNVELTMPEISQTVILSRVAGRTSVPQSQSLAALSKTRATLCLYLSVDKINEIVPVLQQEYGMNCPTAVVYRASWPDQQIIRGTLENIHNLVKDARIRKTAIILVGDALGETENASKLYDAAFTHEYRSGSSS